ncbi:MAG: efflux RND transporter periplasmic adaptor subunit [Mesorhizobium sp.]
MFRAFLPAVLAIAAAAVPQAALAAEFVVHATTIPEMKAVYGQVESRTIVPARARIAGTISDIRIAEGSEVRKGDVVAVVVDDKIALQLEAAEAKIGALRSQLANARTDLERAQRLLSRGVTAQSQLDAATMELDVITNQVAAAEADKAVIEQSAREGEVLAPADGRVLTVPVTPGSVVMAGEAIARIAGGPYYLRLSLPERHAAEIVEGASVEVGARGRAPLPDGAAAMRPGRIVKVYPEIADGRVIADVDVADIGTYFVNERTLVSIPVGRRSVLAVPPEAIRTLHGIDYVRVAGADGETDVAVIPGDSFEEDGQLRTVILTGLADGDRVVLP